MWDVETRVEGFPCRGLLRHKLADRALVYMAAWHWGRKSSVVEDTLGYPDRTALYVGLPSPWDSVADDCFPFVSWDSSLMVIPKLMTGRINK
jgi:hypothetical protein